MRNTTKILGWAGLFGLVCSTPALAYFNVNDDSSDVPHKCGHARVVQYGSGSPDAIGGFGTQVPLKKALNALVPAGWHVKVTHDVNKQKINWTEGQNWVSAIGQGTSNQTCIVVDWDHQWVLASKEKINKKDLKSEESGGHQITKPDAGVTELAVNDSSSDHKPDAHAPKSSDTQKTNSSGDYGSTSFGDKAQEHEAKKATDKAASEKTKKAAPTPPESTSKHVATSPDYFFHVADNERLSEALGDFLKKHGWDIAWESPIDYPVKYGFSVHGKTIASVLSHITELYPLEVRLFNGNRVARFRSATDSTTPIIKGSPQ